MRLTVDLPVADWPTLPQPGDTVAEVTSGTYALPLSVITAERLGETVRLELDAPARTIERFTGEPVEFQPRQHQLAPSGGASFVCSVASAD
jgi:hypothetical protein